MGLPLAVCHFHIGKHRLKGRFLRGTGIDAETDFSIALLHMANSHLLEAFPVCGAFNAIIIFPAAEAIPHRFDPDTLQYRTDQICDSSL